MNLDHLSLLQILVALIFSARLIASFFISWIKRKRITLGSLETTIIPLVIFLPLVIVLNFHTSLNEFMAILFQIIGVIFMSAGWIISSIAFSKLEYVNSDDFWFGRNEIKDRHLVTTGIYGVIRHPIALGFFLTYSGLLLVFLHIVPTIITVLGFLFIIYTSYQEEKFMISKFPEYAGYKKRTHMFIPYIW